MPGSAREEAERLVAAVLARAAAAGGHASGGHASGNGFGLLGDSVAGLLGVLSRNDLATGSAQCCVCPVCKAIAALRDPSPETAARLAAGAGDIAGGVAGLMRAFSSLGTERPRRPSSTAHPAPAPEQDRAAATRSAPASGRAWAAATRSATGDESPPRDEESDPWGAASADDAREAAARAAAAARARAAAAEEAVAAAVARAKARAARPAATAGPRPAGPGSRAGDVWAMATSEAPAGDAAEPRSVDHESGAAAPEDRDAGPGDDARPGAAV